ncbi:MAG TPA: glycine betaine/L-proline ABC transporter ATP-binding protein [Gammaproteobacteria bacterium]|nr:glycine betaine/L-proline ABC transporter ATP-binding protein [Gammaproteobacteria bacterium]
MSQEKMIRAPLGADADTVASPEAPADTAPSVRAEVAGEIKIRVQGLTKIFGSEPERAQALLEQGADKERIFNETGQAVGLADVSFDVVAGETVVVMGLSGSGKSTLIRCVNRLIEPTFGTVSIDGRDICALNSRDLLELRRTKFGMVFQHFALFPHRNVISNVEYGLEVQGVPAGQRTERAREALKLVGLEGWEQATPGQLSGGMQQRVGLARALAVDPDILLMDEAFSALDPLIRRDMQHELVSLQERVHKTILFITHDLDEALKIGDRIILMKDGRVVQIGTPEEILTSPADVYVERFVEDVDKTRVLTARAVMARARVVGYPGDGPRTALHKMGDENLSTLFVVKRDYTLVGMVRVDAVSEALKRGDKTIEQVIEHELPTVGPDSTLTELIGILAEWSGAVPVVDEHRKLLGVVVKAGVLEALAERGAA